MMLALPNIGNGPIAVGLSAASEDRADPAYRVYAAKKTARDAVYTSMVKLVPAAATPADIRAWADWCAMICSRGWYLPCDRDIKDASAKWVGPEYDSNVVRVQSQNSKLVKYAHPGDSDSANAATFAMTARAEMKAITEALKGHAVAADPGRCALVPITAKICWWIANHHTGQGALLTYMKKALQLFFGLKGGVEPSAVQIALARAAGHYIDTASCLAGLGVTGIPVLVTKDKWPVLSSDAKLRMSSGPAGTGAIAAAHAILRRAASSPYRLALEAGHNYADLIACNVHTMSARHHVGSQFLTGMTQLPLMNGADDMVLCLAAFIHAVAKKSTLASAPSIPGINEVTAHITYTTIMQAQSSLAMRPSAAVIGHQIGALLGGGTQADPLAAVRTSLAMPDQAIMTVQAAQAAIDKSADDEKKKP
jgi:hypothetical protein